MLTKGTMTPSRLTHEHEYYHAFPFLLHTVQRARKRQRQLHDRNSTVASSRLQRSRAAAWVAVAPRRATTLLHFLFSPPPPPHVAGWRPRVQTGCRRRFNNLHHSLVRVLLIHHVDWLSNTIMKADIFCSYDCRCSTFMTSPVRTIQMNDRSSVGFRIVLHRRF